MDDINWELYWYCGALSLDALLDPVDEAEDACIAIGIVGATPAVNEAGNADNLVVVVRRAARVAVAGAVVDLMDEAKDVRIAIADALLALIA